MLCKWDELPENMQNDAVRPYYDSLQKKKFSLLCKAVFDRLVSGIMLIGLSPIFLILAIMIKLDSPGEVFFRQERITKYGKKFRIHKFRTMVKDAESLGAQVTTKSDMRVTKIGQKLRGCRLDELPQLIDILQGNMSFVGTRPEVTKYVDQYTPEMMATLLLPAGVTSLASILYKDEAKLLDGVEDTDKVYMERILPAKMYYNLKQVEQFSFWYDIELMFMTVFAVLGKEYKGDYVPNTETSDDIKVEV